MTDVTIPKKQWDAYVRIVANLFAYTRFDEESHESGEAWNRAVMGVLYMPTEYVEARGAGTDSDARTVESMKSMEPACWAQKRLQRSKVMSMGVPIKEWTQEMHEQYDGAATMCLTPAEAYKIYNELDITLLLEQGQTPEQIAETYFGNYPEWVEDMVDEIRLRAGVYI